MAYYADTFSSNFQPTFGNSDAEPPSPPFVPPPGPWIPAPDVDTSVAFLLCDLLTGRVLAELPLGYGDNIKRMIGRVENQTFTLPPLDERCPEDWAQLVVPGKSMIVLTLDDTPTQAWTLDEHELGDTTVPLTCSTIETCMARTNVPDLDGYGLDLSVVAATLCAELGPRFGFVVEWQASGKICEEEEYSTLEDINILDAVNALQKVGGDMEWRTVLRWADDSHRAVVKVIDIRPKIGRDRPDAIFDLDRNGKGVVESYRRRSSFAAGKGATMVIGTSEGSGASRPMTEPLLSSLAFHGWPIWEERKNFTGLGQGEIDEDTELQSRSVALLVQREAGQVTWTITGSELGPKPGIDYTEGDTVHIAIAPQGKLDPIGGTAAVRVLGWELDPASGRSTVIVWEDEGDSDG